MAAEASAEGVLGLVPLGIARTRMIPIAMSAPTMMKANCDGRFMCAAPRGLSSLLILPLCGKSSKPSARDAACIGEMAHPPQKCHDTKAEAAVRGANRSLQSD